MGSFSVVVVVIKKKNFCETIVVTLDPFDANVMLNQSNDKARAFYRTTVFRNGFLHSDLFILLARLVIIGD